MCICIVKMLHVSDEKRSEANIFLFLYRLPTTKSIKRAIQAKQSPMKRANMAQQWMRLLKIRAHFKRSAKKKVLARPISNMQIGSRVCKVASFDYCSACCMGSERNTIADSRLMNSLSLSLTIKRAWAVTAAPLARCTHFEHCCSRAEKRKVRLNVANERKGLRRKKRVRRRIRSVFA